MDEQMQLIDLNQMAGEMHVSVPAEATRLKHLGKRDLGGGGTIDVPKIDPRTIVVVEGRNHRVMSDPRVQAHILWLKSDIKNCGGVIEPLEVEYIDRVPYLVSGHCRLSAVLLLWREGTEVYVPIRQVSGDEAEIEAAGLRSNTGLPPTILEFGERARKLAGYGWSVERIAQLAPPHLGAESAKKAFVRNSIELSQAPLEVKAMVQKGIDGVEISPAAAISAVRSSRKAAPEKLREAAAQAKADGKTSIKRPKAEAKRVQVEKRERESKNVLMENADSLAGAVAAWRTDATKAAEDNLLEALHNYERFRNKQFGEDQAE